MTSLVLYFLLVFVCGIVAGIFGHNIIILKRLNGTIYFSEDEEGKPNFILGLNSVDGIKKLDGKIVVMDVAKVYLSDLKYKSR